MKRQVALSFSVSFLLGCSGGGSVPATPPPTFDPAAVGQAAIAEYDKNKSGAIDGAELDACPALRFSLASIDRNNDQKLTAADIQKRLEHSPRGTLSVTCKVTLDGQPLVGATVIFEPEAFMGSGVKSSTSTTDKNGSSGVGVPAGFYRIRITKEGTNIPARYNTQTTLGREVHVEPRQSEALIELTLTSR